MCTDDGDVIAVIGTSVPEHRQKNQARRKWLRTRPARCCKFWLALNLPILTSDQLNDNDVDCAVKITQLSPCAITTGTSGAR